MLINTIELSKDLIRCPSVTPKEAGAIGVVEKNLKNLGFKCTRMSFSESGSEPVENLYARIGTKEPNFCFAGHTDVVPPGDANAWDSPPFEPLEHNGFLFGRGAADMKCAIAAMISGTATFLASKHTELEGSISFLITGDEEGPAINGTTKVLDWMKKHNEIINACLVGEPTNPGSLGEMIKIGRRGSMNINLSVIGAQGHAAYPHLADNPIHKLLQLMSTLVDKPLDSGSDHFEPSSIQFTSVDVGNTATNIIPATAEAKCNIRFNDLHTGDSIKQLIKKRLDQIDCKYSMVSRLSGESFLTKPGHLSEIAKNVVSEITGLNPVLSTTGGTSDARFIKDYCSVIEFGLCNKTAHKVNECALIDEINTLAEVYAQILFQYFK